MNERALGVYGRLFSGPRQGAFLQVLVCTTICAASSCVVSTLEASVSPQLGIARVREGLPGERAATSSHGGRLAVLHVPGDLRGAALQLEGRHLGLRLRCVPAR